MEEGGEDEVDDHEGEGAPCFRYGEKTDEAYYGEVDACCCLLESTGVD